MSPKNNNRHLIRTIVCFLALSGFGHFAYAGGSDEKDFSLRFPAALSRFSSYADVAATGGASAGSKWQSSVNPASTAWQGIPGRYQLSLSPQYSSIIFQEGAVLHVISESVTRNSAKLGAFQAAFAQVRSNDRDTRQGVKFSYAMDYMQVQWGKRFSEDLAFGGNFNYASSEVTNKIGAARFADSSSDSYGGKVGTLYRITEKFLGGLVVDFSWSPSTTTYYDLFGSGMGDVRVRDRTKQFALRTGPSYEYMKGSTINVDYQYGVFENNTGKMEVHRMLSGIDQRIVDAVFVRGGFALDNNGNTSWTCGLGIYPLKHVSIDVGYQYNMFPEIQAEFGRSHLLTISISVIR